MSQEKNVELGVVPAIEISNQIQKNYFAGKIARYFKGNLVGHKIAVWGLAFKPNTDDMREAPSIDIVKYFSQQGAVIQAFDPVAIREAKEAFRET